MISIDTQRFSRLVVPAALALTIGLSSCGSPEEPIEETDPNWSVGVSLPAPLTGFGAAVYRGAIYIAGGLANADVVLDETFRYDPAAGTWWQLGYLPTNRADIRLVVAGDSLYAIGGWHELPDGISAEDHRMLVLDPDTEEWLDRGRLPDMRSDPAIAGAPGLILMVSGGLGSLEHGGLTPGDTVAIYETATAEWRYGSAIQIARMNATAAYIDGKVYVIGGTDAAGGGAVELIEVYDVETDTWSTAEGRYTAITEGVYSQASVVTGTEVRFFGGWIPSPDAPSVDDHRVYDVLLGEWRFESPLPTPRSGAAAVHLDGQVFVMGGFKWFRALPDAATDTVEVYRP